MKPEKAPVVQGQGLYRVYMNRKPIDLLFRARNAGEADLMMQFLFSEQTKGKTLSVPQDLLDQYRNGGTNDKTEEPKAEEAGQASAQGGCEAGHPADAGADAQA